MSQTKIYKYNMILLNVSENTASILHTDSEFNKSLEFMQKYLDSNFKLDQYLKAQYDNNFSISLYKYHYFSSKELIFKIQIVQFVDVLFNNCKNCNVINVSPDYPFD